jgi:pyruvate dehydrogenase E2 component (dihydrolipoamide acetyltransferase)
MSTQIKLPHLGEHVESGDVLSILVAEGDTVSADQDLIELETEKATVMVPSPGAGKITKVLISEGDTIKVGAPIMEIESAAEGAKPKAKEAKQPAAKKPKAEPKPERAKENQPAEEQPAEPEPEGGEPAAKSETAAAGKKERKEARGEQELAPAEQTAARAASGPPKSAASDASEPRGDGHAAAAGPAVRRLARQLGVDLRRVRPTGEGGRITEEDVQAHVRETNEQAEAALPPGVTPPGAPDGDEFGAVRIEKMSRMRQTIARTMLQSYTTIPQLTNFDDVDVTELEAMREESKADYAARGIKLTAMPFLVKAVASSLRRHPLLNASVDMENNEIIYKEYIHVGIAVDTERGLVVPVLRDADRKSISQIAMEMDQLVSKVRSGDFGLEDLRGGTFTISNLGSVGGTYSTPIINPPEVAILLAGRSRILPQIVDDAVEGRLIMPLSITYDHRVVDGAAAARFLNEVKGYLAAPGRLLLAP